jgi:hypothetical protein
LTAIVAMSPDIRTRTLRSLYIAINPSRMFTLRTADCFHSLLATKNFRSISTGLCCSCSFGRSDFSRTEIHGVDGTRAAALDQRKYDADMRTWPDASDEDGRLPVGVSDGSIYSQNAVKSKT